MPAAEKPPLTDVLQRARLIDRLMAASGLLAGQGWSDSSKAVLEAIDALRALPIAEAVHKALQPDSLSGEEFKARTFNLREAKNRMKEYVRTFPIVNGQTLKPVADQDDHDGSTPD